MDRRRFLQFLGVGLAPYVPGVAQLSTAANVIAVAEDKVDDLVANWAVCLTEQNHALVGAGVANKLSSVE